MPKLRKSSHTGQDQKHCLHDTKPTFVDNNRSTQSPPTSRASIRRQMDLPTFPARHPRRSKNQSCGKNASMQDWCGSAPGGMHQSWGEPLGWRIGARVGCGWAGRWLFPALVVGSGRLLASGLAGAAGVRVSSRARPGRSTGRPCRRFHHMGVELWPKCAAPRQPRAGHRRLPAAPRRPHGTLSVVARWTGGSSAAPRRALGGTPAVSRRLLGGPSAANGGPSASPRRLLGRLLGGGHLKADDK